MDHPSESGEQQGHDANSYRQRLDDSCSLHDVMLARPMMRVAFASYAAQTAFNRLDPRVGYAGIAQTVGMPLSEEDVYARLAEADSRAAEFLVEHLKRWHDVQDPYLLMEELRGFCLQLFHEGSMGPLEAILDVVSTAFVDGDFDVKLAIDGNFIGHLPPWTSEMKPFVAVWPPVLKAEAARQTQVWTK